MRHEPLEQFMRSIPISEQSTEIPLGLIDPPMPSPEFKHGNHTPIDGDLGYDDGPEVIDPSAVEIMALPSFQEQWVMMHQMMGGMVQMRTGAPCPLGEQAQSDGGRTACEAAYNLCAASPALSRMILSPESTFFGQLAAIGMHGYGCVQIVRASANGDTLPPPETEAYDHE